MASTVELDAWIKKFCDLVPHLTVDGPRRFSLSDVQGRRRPTFEGWERRSGVYWFEHGGAVRYVGRAMWRKGLLRRIEDHCLERGDAEWDNVWKDRDTVVGVVALPEADWYWAGALEPYLITHCAPQFNKKVC